MFAQSEYGVFQYSLDRGSKVHFTPCDVRFRLPRWAAKQPLKLSVHHHFSIKEPEIVGVQPVRAVRPQIYEMLTDEFLIPGLAVGGESHQLVLAGVHFEATVLGEGAV